MRDFRERAFLHRNLETQGDGKRGVLCKEVQPGTAPQLCGCSQVFTRKNTVTTLLPELGETHRH